MISLSRFEKNFFPVFIVLLILSAQTFSQVKPASIFTNNMVLQQQATVPIWGWSKPGATITCTTSWNNQKISGTADADGKWIIYIKTGEAGGPYEITLTDPIPVKLTNVLLGEVWLCSGQSNMEMPMMGFKGQPVEGSNEAILKSTNNDIRVYTVPRAPVTTPQANSKPSAWKIAGPESISSFSATAYYFARLVQELLRVPVGVINTSYGGSEIESWMPSTSLQDFSSVNIPAPADSIKIPNRTPSALYNGMIHPLIGLGIKGITWYPIHRMPSSKEASLCTRRVFAAIHLQSRFHTNKQEWLVCSGRKGVGELHAFIFLTM